MKKTSLIKHSPQDVFDLMAIEACMVLSASKHTRRAYLGDARLWTDFCRRRRVDPAGATAIVVAAWVESMKQDTAPKTRARRLSALSSVYDWLRRNKKVDGNPFSITEGPKRESAHAVRPTPVAEAEIVLAAIRNCEGGASYDDIRDAAILRVLWATGIRRSSLVELTRERLTAADDAFACAVPAKGGKLIRLWITGSAVVALRRLLSELDRIGITTRHVFRLSNGRPMDEKDVWRRVSQRGRAAGGKLTPHSFRVAFLTINPASLEERQDAVGHSSPETTRAYDRTQWRGKRAFALMPEAEEATKDVTR